MIKGIVMDLDQTLLHNDKQISRYTLQVLEQAKRQGLTLFFATGRSVMRIENYRRQVHPEGLICLNGGLNLWQGQRAVSYTHLDVYKRQAQQDAETQPAEQPGSRAGGPQLKKQQKQRGNCQEN